VKKFFFINIFNYIKSKNFVKILTSYRSYWSCRYFDILDIFISHKI